MNVSPFITIDRLPVHVSALYASAEDARQASTGRLQLVYCDDCSFIYNRLFEADKLVFEPGYSASLAHSATFRAYIDDLVERLITRYSIRNKSVLDIGCGDGFFLKQLCSKGDNHGVGIDPTIGYDSEVSVGNGRVRFISDSFSRKYESLIGNLVCSISVFETISDPRQFLTELRGMIGAREDVVVYFEVPSASYVFRKNATWSLYYEQFAHFTCATLANLFRSCGFEVLQSDNCYEGGQYVYVEARPAKARHEIRQRGAASDSEHRDVLPDVLVEFAETHKASVEFWRTELEKMRTDGKKVVIWGSGGKGTGFANLCRTEGLIEYVVDINPLKQGQYVPCSAQKIVAPEFLREYRPDVVIVTNGIYEDEIAQQVSSLGVTCKYMRID